MINEKKLIETIVNTPSKSQDDCCLEFLEGIATRQHEILDIIKEQPKTDWIPCEVEMPKKNGYYEVTVFRYEGDENNVFDLWYEDGEWYVDEVDEETKDEFLFVHEVIAWQPLPQPYKKEGAENG